MDNEPVDPVQLAVFQIVHRCMLQCYQEGATPKQVHSTMLAAILKELVERNASMVDVLLWVQRSIVRVYNETEKPNAH